MHLSKSAVIAAATAMVAFTLPVNAETVLKASHQWPGGKGDARDEMVQLIAREVEKANVGLKIQVFPGASLVKPKEQWGALTKGQIDLSAFPLDYASGRHPEFSATLMPGLVRNHERAQRMNTSPFMDDIKAVIEKAGVKVISDAWLAGAFASKKTCITSPESIKGQVTRAAGPAFEQMLVAAGASISHAFRSLVTPRFLHSIQKDSRSPTTPSLTAATTASRSGAPAPARTAA